MKKSLLSLFFMMLLASIKHSSCYQTTIANGRPKSTLLVCRSTAQSRLAAFGYWKIDNELKLVDKETLTSKKEFSSTIKNDITAIGDYNVLFKKTPCTKRNFFFKSDIGYLEGKDNQFVKIAKGHNKPVNKIAFLKNSIPLAIDKNDTTSNNVNTIFIVSGSQFPTIKFCLH